MQPSGMLNDGSLMLTNLTLCRGQVTSKSADGVVCRLPGEGFHPTYSDIVSLMVSEHNKHGIPHDDL